MMTNTKSRYIYYKTKSNKAKKVKAADKESIKLVCKTVLDNFSPIIAQAKYTLSSWSSTQQTFPFLNACFQLLKPEIQYK